MKIGEQYDLTFLDIMVEIVGGDDEAVPTPCGAERVYVKIIKGKLRLSTMPTADHDPDGDLAVLVLGPGDCYALPKFLFKNAIRVDAPSGGA